MESDYGVTVSWDNVRNVRVTVSGRYINQTSGLCGTYNDNKDDDFLTPLNTITTSATLFGNSWKTDPMCDNATDPQHPCDAFPVRKEMAKKNCSSLLESPFLPCSNEVNATEESYIADCEYDVCACGTNPYVCLCEAIEAYASECRDHQVEINWKETPGFESCCKCLIFNCLRYTMLGMAVYTTASFARTAEICSWRFQFCVVICENIVWLNTL